MLRNQIKKVKRVWQLTLTTIANVLRNKTGTVVDDNNSPRNRRDRHR
jgi:hypothetical protein